MARQLLLMRHAKSDWSSANGADFDRPLARRGERDAPLMARWIAANQLLPSYVLASPALRAKQTVTAVCAVLDLEVERFDDRIYGASLGGLLRLLGDVPASAERVLLIGHNPGMEELLDYLCGGEFGDLVSSDKLMPTAAIAVLEMPLTWDRLPPGCARLLQHTRPRALLGRKGA